MDILVVAADSARLQIIYAGLELSGYQSRVSQASTLDNVRQIIAHQKPLLVVYFRSIDDPLSLAALVNLSGDVPVLTISADAEATDLHLPYPYRFQDLLQIVNHYVPLATDARKLEQQNFASRDEEEHKYRDLFDRASDAIMLIDFETHFIFDVNQQAVKLYGYALDEFIGMSLLQIVPEDEYPSMLHNTRTMGDYREVIHVPKRTHIAKNGTRLTVSISASIIEYGGRRIFQDIVRDETERVRYEEELKQLVQLKDQFVSNISHELRTPIANLRLREHLIAKQPEQFDQHLAVLVRETTRLSSLIEDLLILSRLDQGRQAFGFTEVDLNVLIQHHLEDRGLLAAQKGIVLTNELTPRIPPVQGSHEMLDQVLGIMLTNAIAYTPTGGKVTISTHPTELEGKQWIGFSIKDTGFGIPPAEQQLLFTRFYRGSAASKLPPLKGVALKTRT